MLRNIGGRIILLTSLLSIFLAACAAGGLNAADAQATAHDLAGTAVAITLAALPTNTSVPTSTPEPSPTPSPLASDTPTLEPSATFTATFAPTWTPYGQMESTQLGTAQADKADQNAPLQISNQSGEDEITFTLLSPVHQEYQIKNGLTLILPEGTYTYRVRLEKKTMNGSFTITNGDKHVLTIYADKVHFAGP
ncbi:MAG: hypothetical protein WD751_04715 [Anaerolineales bacterium]